MKTSTDRVDGRRPRYGHVIVLAQIMILAMFLIIAILYSLFEQYPKGFIYPLCALIVILFAWTLWSWRALTGSLFDPYTLFMTSAFAFNAGQAFLEVLHLNKGGILNGLFSQQTIVKTLLLVTTGLIAFHLGALLAVFKTHRKVRSSAENPRKVQDNRSLRLVGFGLIYIAAIPTVIVLKQYIAVVMSSGYSGLYQQPVATGFGTWPTVLSGFIVPGSFFLLAGSERKRSFILLSSGSILIYCVITLFLGARVQAIMVLLAYLWLWHRTIRKVPKTALATIAVLLIIVIIPSIAAFRNLSGPERLSWKAFANANRSVVNPTVAALSEMGTSMQTISHTIELVPESRAYDLGATYYYALLAIFPNAFWSVHPSAARASPAVWLVATVEPSTAALGGGLGYSFIAEAYLNFGWWGSPIVLFLIGFLFCILVLWADRSGNNARLAMVASFLPFFVFFARGQSVDLIRPLVWYSALPYSAVYFLGKRASGKPIGIEAQGAWGRS